MDVFRVLQRAEGKRWYRFVRIRGGSPLNEIVPVTFKFPRHLAKDARRVSLVGPFNHWSSHAHPLTRTAEGDWHVTIHLPPGRISYLFDVDGSHWLDPCDEGREPNGWGSEYSVRHVEPTSDRSSGFRPPSYVVPIQGGAQALGRPVEPPEAAAGRPVGVDEAGAMPVFRDARSSRLMTVGGQRSLEWWFEERLEADLLLVNGEIDGATAPDFEAALSEAIVRGRSVVVSLRGIQLLDSRALCCLDRARPQLSRDGRRLVLVEPSPTVRRILKTAGFHNTFPLFSSIKAGLRYLAGVAQDAPNKRARSPARRSREV
jgi:anti-anti-sigma factor